MGTVREYVCRKAGPVHSPGTVQVLQWVGKGEGDQDGRLDLQQHQWHHCTAQLPAKVCTLAFAAPRARHISVSRPPALSDKADFAFLPE